MDTRSAFEAKLLEPAVAAGDLPSLERIAPIWKTLLEAEKAQTDIADAASKRRSEGVKFWVPILAPLISAGALIATLVFQVHQFRENAALMAQTAEDTAWRDALNRAKDVRGPDSAFAASMLKSFFSSERYGNAAREISVLILGHMVAPDVFDILFPDVVATTQKHEIGDIARIAANLNQVYHNVANGREPGMSPTERDRVLSGLSRNIETAGRELARLLRWRQESVNDLELNLDLTGVQFGTTNLSDVYFDNTIIEGTIFFHCNVSGARFSKILGFDGSTWGETVWWNADIIDADLLQYLMKEFPYDKNTDYGGDENATPEGYSKALLSLRKRTQN